jgi:hypothetical protein
MEERDPKVGVHASHCCKRHGCKYGDKDCPVVSGSVKQDYPCEWCDELVGRKSPLREAMYDIMEYCEIHLMMGHLSYDDAIQKIKEKILEIEKIKEEL